MEHELQGNHFHVDGRCVPVSDLAKAFKGGSVIRVAELPDDLRNIIVGVSDPEDSMHRATISLGRKKAKDRDLFLVAARRFIIEEGFDNVVIFARRKTQIVVEQVK